MSHHRACGCQDCLSRHPLLYGPCGYCQVTPRFRSVRFSGVSLCDQPLRKYFGNWGLWVRVTGSLDGVYCLQHAGYCLWTGLTRSLTISTYTDAAATNLIQVSDVSWIKVSCLGPPYTLTPTWYLSVTGWGMGFDGPGYELPVFVGSLARSPGGPDAVDCLRMQMPNQLQACTPAVWLGAEGHYGHGGEGEVFECCEGEPCLAFLGAPTPAAYVVSIAGVGACPGVSATLGGTWTLAYTRDPGGCAWRYVDEQYDITYTIGLAELSGYSIGYTSTLIAKVLIDGQWRTFFEGTSDRADYNEMGPSPVIDLSTDTVASGLLVGQCGGQLVGWGGNADLTASYA